MKTDGVEISLVKLCQRVGVARCMVYYRKTKGEPNLLVQFVKPIKDMIEENPSVGYRTRAHQLGFNINTVQRMFQLLAWQVRKRLIGFRPRIQALPSVAQAPNQRCTTNLCRGWFDKDGWSHLALVIDCLTRELLGWQLSCNGRSKTADAALEQALISR